MDAMDRLRLSHGTYVRQPRLQTLRQRCGYRGYHWRTDGASNEAVRLLLECS